MTLLRETMTESETSTVSEHIETIKFQYDTNTYEFSINPNDKIQSFGSKNRFNHVIQTMHNKILRVVRDYKIQYKLYLECSHPHYNIHLNSIQPRLHYHGTITFATIHNVADFLVYVLPTLAKTCSVSVNEFRPDHWPEYVSKQAYIWKPYCNKKSLPYELTEKTRPFIIPEDKQFKFTY